MASTAGLSVNEYLHSCYDPDCDYVDGELVERNVGELDHSEVQTLLVGWFLQRRTELGIRVLVEQRVRVSPKRYRVPDVCVLLGGRPQEQVLTNPPFLCIEVLSPEDRMTRVNERIHDFLNSGVRYLWLIDPKTRQAWVYTAGAIQEVADGFLRTQSPDIALPIASLFDES